MRLNRTAIFAGLMSLGAYGVFLGRGIIRSLFGLLFLSVAAFRFLHYGPTDKPLGMNTERYWSLVIVAIGLIFIGVFVKEYWIRELSGATGWIMIICLWAMRLRAGALKDGNLKRSAKGHKQ